MENLKTLVRNKNKKVTENTEHLEADGSDDTDEDIDLFDWRAKMAWKLLFDQGMIKTEGNWFQLKTEFYRMRSTSVVNHVTCTRIT